MRALAIVIVYGFAAYLIVLGLIALLDRGRAFRFLRGFAQTRRANAVEAACRITVGVAFIVLAPDLPLRPAFLGFGWVLVLSAIAMLALPDLHRRFADRVVPAIALFLPLIGLVSLAAGSFLAIILWSLIALGFSPY